MGGPVLRLDIQKSPQITLLRCSGRIVKADGADTLVQAVMAENERHILIDLHGVSAIDAAGLGALAELECWARDSSRSLHLVNPSRPVRRALEVTGLSAVLKIEFGNAGRAA